VSDETEKDRTGLKRMSRMRKTKAGEPCLKLFLFRRLGL
jgi:hypothetical protein